jgi:Ser/Thr protein kinase RdoA (MazF antagonist)
MATAPEPGFDQVLHRMYVRTGVGELPAHLEATYDIAVLKMVRLDVGVFRIDRRNGTPLVARLFSAARPRAAAEGDLAALRYLAEVGFPAERPFAERPLTTHDGQALLITEFVRQVARPKRPPYPIVTLGAMVGRLHGLPVPVGADRPSGALHHFAEGTMADELRAVAGWLEWLEARAPTASRDAVASIRAAVDVAEGGTGLPEAFVHPDPVPKNAIFTAGGPVLVDWTSAGRGPRLASMALVLRSGWAAVPFMKGYAKAVTLTDEERDRLGGLLFSRQLIDLVFRVCREPGTAGTAASAARRIPALRRDAEAKAHTLLGT